VYAIVAAEPSGSPTQDLVALQTTTTYVMQSDEKPSKLNSTR